MDAVCLMLMHARSPHLQYAAHAFALRLAAEGATVAVNDFQSWVPGWADVPAGLAADEAVMRAHLGTSPSVVLRVAIDRSERETLASRLNLNHPVARLTTKTTRVGLLAKPRSLKVET